MQSDQHYKLQTYVGQLNALLAQMESHDAFEELAALIDELGNEAQMPTLAPRAILDINKEVEEALEDGNVADDERKFVGRALRACGRVIRTFNLSGTEQILTGAALKKQWTKRNAMGRGELEPPRYDGKGNLFFGVAEGRLYEDGMKVNGERDGYFYYAGKRYNGWHQGFYYQNGLRHTGNRLTYNTVIEYRDGREVGRKPRNDLLKS